MLKVPICAFTLIRIHKRHCYTWPPSSASAARCLGLPPDTAAAFLKVWSNRNKSPAWALDRFRVAATTAARWRHLRCVMASVSVSVKCLECDILCPLLLADVLGVTAETEWNQDASLRTPRPQKYLLLIFNLRAYNKSRLNFLLKTKIQQT